MDAQLGGEAEGAGEIQIALQASALSMAGVTPAIGAAFSAARRQGDHHRGLYQPALVARQIEIRREIQRAESQTLDPIRRRDLVHGTQAPRRFDQRHHDAALGQRRDLVRPFRLRQDDADGGKRSSRAQSPPYQGVVSSLIRISTRPSVA